MDKDNFEVFKEKVLEDILRPEIVKTFIRNKAPRFYISNDEMKDPLCGYIPETDNIETFSLFLRKIVERKEANLVCMSCTSKGVKFDENRGIDDEGSVLLGRLLESGRDKEANAYVKKLGGIMFDSITLRLEDKDNKDNNMCLSLEIDEDLSLSDYKEMKDDEYGEGTDSFVSSHGVFGKSFFA